MKKIMFIALVILSTTAFAEEAIKTYSHEELNDIATRSREWVVEMDGDVLELDDQTERKKYFCITGTDGNGNYTGFWTNNPRKCDRKGGVAVKIY